jgi:predicted DsbA family dithiol-disulfide isomerase
MPAEYRARIDANKPRLLAMAQEQYGLELNQGPFGIDSRPALRGAKFAEAQGLGGEYHHAMMYGYWTEAKDIGDLDVLTELAVSIGLDREAFLAALNAPDIDDEVQSDIDQAQQLGINSVPAMVFDNRCLISGAQPYPVLVQATEHVQAELQKSEA